MFRRRWPADVQLIGKDILWFHAAIWPAMLMALGLEPPKGVFAHGWWTHNGEKMSKSKNNFVTPGEVADAYGADALRYFLLRELPFGMDGDFRDAAMLQRYNAELAGDLGNFVFRTLSMMDRYFEGVVPDPGAEPRGALAEAAASLFRRRGRVHGRASVQPRAGAHLGVRPPREPVRRGAQALGAGEGPRPAAPRWPRRSITWRKPRASCRC